MLSPLSVLASWSWCNRAFLSVCQMSTISEEEWKIALTEMPQVIIEHYGVETSVLEINKIMDRIPRRDPTVQDRLRPFVERLEKKQESERRGEFIL